MLSTWKYIEIIRDIYRLSGPNTWSKQNTLTTGNIGLQSNSEQLQGWTLQSLWALVPWFDYHCSGKFFLIPNQNFFCCHLHLLLTHSALPTRAQLCLLHTLLTSSWGEQKPQFNQLLLVHQVLHTANHTRRLTLVCYYCLITGELETQVQPCKHWSEVKITLLNLQSPARGCPSSLGRLMLVTRTRLLQDPRSFFVAETFPIWAAPRTVLFHDTLLFHVQDSPSDELKFLPAHFSRPVKVPLTHSPRSLQTCWNLQAADSVSP